MPNKQKISKLSKAALAFFTPEEYAKLLTVAEDVAELDPTWEEWHANAEHAIQELAANGLDCVPMPITVSELTQYCLQKNLPINSAARAEYASAKLQRQTLGLSDAEASDIYTAASVSTNIATSLYRDPVAQLLSLPPAVDGEDVSSVNYLQTFGFTHEHVPELLRMATDPHLYREDSTDEEYESPFHAIRALTALQVVSVLDPLLTFRVKAPHIDISTEELDSVLQSYFVAIGSVALPALIALLKDQSQEMYTRGMTVDILEAMVPAHPDLRDQIISVLTDQLQVPENDDASEIPSFIVAALAQMKAIESVAEMKRAFDSGLLDRSIVDNWEYIEYQLGLRAEPPEELFHDLFSSLSSSSVKTTRKPTDPSPFEVIAHPANPKASVPNRQKSFKKIKPKKKSMHTKKKGPRK